MMFKLDVVFQLKDVQDHVLKIRDFALINGHTNILYSLMDIQDNLNCIVMKNKSRQSKISDLFFKKKQ